MALTEEMIDLIFKHRDLKEMVVLRNFNTNVPSWQEFIDYINMASRQKDPSHSLTDYEIKKDSVWAGSMKIMQKFYFYIMRQGNMWPDAPDLGISRLIEEEFSKALGVVFGFSHVYVTLSDNIDSVPQHEDPADNFYWQCIGSTEWEFNDKKYIVNPGDMVYVPAKSLHGVNFLGPRAAIGFGCNFSKRSN